MMNTSNNSLTRALWNGQSVSALGFGCWAIGGPFYAGTQPLGWGEVDDRTSIAAIHAALECGVRFFDTADVYGTGRSESVLGAALKNRSEDVIIATKFGNTFDIDSNQLTGTDISPAYIRSAVKESLQRLQGHPIALYQLHMDVIDSDGDELSDILEELIAEDKIHAYGWSSDDIENIKKWDGKPGFKAVQHALNLFQPSPQILQHCKSNGLLSINRSPLAMGVLSNKFDNDLTLGKDDVRGTPPEWLKLFEDGKPRANIANALSNVRDILTQDGRTLSQGALCWIWGVTDVSIPIPGARTPQQVIENAGALQFGPLSSSDVTEIEEILSSI